MGYDPAKKRAYYLANRERLLAKQREHRTANLEVRKERSRKWNAANRDYIYAKNLRQYGLTPETYAQMEQAQGGVCAICANKQSDKRKAKLCVDHCHATGVVRGLLCSTCNSGIGLLKDSADLLLAAYRYLADK